MMKKAEEHIHALLALFEDPNREGLLETPKRVAKAWAHYTRGYSMRVEDVLKTFEEGVQSYQGMVIVHNIPIVSTCMHHLAPITGHAHIGYIPNGKVVGLSKLARVAEVYMRRLQIQEALTCEIAEALNKHLQPLGVGVMIRAAHGCMSMRGVQIHGATTTTSSLLGAMEETAARAEFFSLCNMAEKSS